jgi:trimethylamine---corrinoid protein Co-methyltransferase
MANGERMRERRERRRGHHERPRQPSVAPGGLETQAYQPLSAADIRRIHEASLQVLERTGVEIEPSEARDILLGAGATLDASGMRVCFPRALVEDALAKACHEFVLPGRSEQHDMVIGGNRVYMGTGGAAVKVMELDGRVRDARLGDVARIGKLVDALENIHFYLRPVEPTELPVDVLDVNKTYAAVANTTKHVMVSAYTVQSARDVIELAAMIAGSKEAYEERPFVSFTSCWTVSPLRYAPETVEVLLELLRQNVPVVLSSAPQSGATSPASLAGTLVQINAEELSGIVLANLVRPSARILMGYVPSVADMRTGSFTSGSPEFALMNAAAAQLAHFYNIPVYNSSSLTDSKLPDVQAGYEKGISAATAALAGTNYIHHSAGFLESMLCVAYEQYVIDDEINGSVMRLVRGIEVTDETLCVEEIDRVCRGEGHYLGSDYTLALMNTEYYYPHTGDRQRRADWENGGGLDMRERARRVARNLLESHEPQRIDLAIDAAIRDRFDIRLPPELAGVA